MTAWTVEEDTLLIERVKLGWSASLIAELFPTRTRNSIIGRCTRQGITLDGDTVQRRQRKKRVKLARKPCESPPVSPGEAGRDILAPKDKEPVAGIPGPFQCKYPIEGLGVKTIYCLNKRTDKSYCNKHQEICYQASWR